MFFSRRKYSLPGYIIILFCCCNSVLFAQQKDSLRFPINDRRADQFNAPKSHAFDFNDSLYLKREVKYDPKTKTYYVEERIGSRLYRKPVPMSFQQFYQQQSRQAEVDYFRKRADALTLLNKKAARPKLKVYDQLFDRMFGLGPNGLKVDIRPQGEVNILAGYQGQNIKNPTLAERARRNGGFDFDMNANLGVNASIGDKLRFPINYNTLSNLNFDNQIKLDYKGMDDEMIKSIEAGNISFQSKGTLIPGAQNLFGIKTQLQFGKLFVTAAIANQRSQRQSVALQGGASTNTFQKKLDDYEENKHFLLAQYFRNNYNKSMSQLPIVSSQVQILRMDVWVTNRTGATTESRDVVGLMDLAETNPYRTGVVNPLSNNPLPDNRANDLYAYLTANPANRNPVQITSQLLAKGLRPVEDFEKTFARKLSPNEYYFNPQIGFLSLNTQLQPDEVLGVAFQYTFNGRVYQVGEFAQDVGLDSTQGVQKVLFLKLLKATSQRPTLPIWGLMMKNVYTLDLFGGIQREDFKLNVLYEEPSGGLKRYLPETAPTVEGQPLLRILNLDRLNNRNDPQPDGVFDWIEGFTILPQQGRIVFPVLEPFGRDLDRLAYNGQATALKQKYIYYQLYDSIKAIAQTYANVNRFVMQGQAKGTGGSEIFLNTFNIPRGSVTVSAGGQLLREGADYVIDYNLGSVKILNQGILSSGIPVQVSFENNAGFGLQQRGFTGLRLDYLANKKLALGFSTVRLGERPFFTKMNYGDDPIRNTMFGLDFSYRSDLPGLTRALNKLPFYSTKAPSNITAYGEAALLKPGHPPQIGRAEQGLIYLDDFEGTRNNIDLRFPFVAWNLASTPQGNPKFPEAILTDSVDYNKNRAKLAWYQIEPNLQDRNSPNNPLRRNLSELSDPRVRQVFTNELFPQRTTNITDIQAFTFDMAFYPRNKGPYNFENRIGQITDSGHLTNPAARWGGIMRALDQTDFETGNIEFVEFWIQDPFIRNTNSRGGKLFLNLGNISEDILKDGRRFYENGLNTPTIPAAVDSSNAWGKAPVNPIQITQAFSNDPADRPFQDVGLDGVDDAAERRKRQNYLNRLAQNFGTNSFIYRRALNDPSDDNYVWFRDASYDASATGILGRYKNFNNPQGNSPLATTGGQFTPAATLYPDNEDLNRDNTLNESEEYYEYQIDLFPNMNVGSNKYITDRRTVIVNSADGIRRTENWYLFRVPIRDYSRKVGNIPDFKSIRFMRWYMTDFEDSVVLRFVKMDLVRNQWRQFTYNLDTAGNYIKLPNNSPTTFNTLAVNLEENSARQPVNYVIPPGIERVQQLSNNGVNLLQNEQALSIQVRNLTRGDARGVFKTVPFDMRQYGKLSMFAHIESIVGQAALRDGDANLVVRLGQDFLNNYYEIKIPLKVTPPGTYTAGQANIVWPDVNNLDFSLRELVELKLRRNQTNQSFTTMYRERIGNKTFSVFGNPNLGEVRGILVAIENANPTSTAPMYAEMWVNELRLSALDEKSAWAALGRVDMTLADLGTLSVSANTYTQGFGTIEQRVNERARDNLVQFDIATNLNAGKLTPAKWGLSLPVYASINRTIHAPQYDPYDRDVLYQSKLNTSGNKRDSIRNTALDQTTIKTINFTNVRLAPSARKPQPWRLSNFDVSYSFTQTEQRSPLVTENKVTRYRAGLGYTFSGQPRFIEPMRYLIKGNSNWLKWLKEFNFNITPSLIGFRADVNRQFGQFVPRIVNTIDSKVERVDTTYDKFFTFDRFYNMRWDLTRSLNIDFSATNNARVDEPFGRIDKGPKRDSVRNNFLKGGRNTLYQQTANLTYTLPLSKIPLVDWVNARYSYKTTYNWVGASLIARSLGNVIENGQDNNLTGEFDFRRLYAKSRWLRALEDFTVPVRSDADVQDNKNKRKRKPTPPPPGPAIQQPVLGSSLPSKEEVVKDLKGKARRDALRKWRQQRRDERLARRLSKQNEPVDMNDFVRAGGRLLTMVKNVNVSYTENLRSRLPGFMDSSKILGNNFGSMAPGLGYVFGKQPDTAMLNNFASRGLMSSDSNFNFLFRQNFEQRLSITAQAEPIREFNISINLDKSFNKDYSELFKDTLSNGKFAHLSPLASGGFSVSYMAMNTLFRKQNPNEISQTFREFEQNRQIISRRIAATNPYWQSLPPAQQFTSDGYARGYGRYSQDVLIPAFLAAYTGKDPNNVPLIGQNNATIRTNPFKGVLPKPNWRVTYTGLTKLPALAEKFSMITLSHGYNSTLSMNSFASALLYRDPFGLGAPGFVDTVSGNYIPYFLVPNLSMQEAFAPLIGIDITTVNQLNLKFEYKRSRQLSLSLVDFQLAETRSTEWVFGFSWRKRGIHLPFQLPFMRGKTMENDLSFKLDLSMRDEQQSNSRLDQSNAYGTGGQKVITIQPAIDYVLNNRINLKFFFDQRRAIPYISTSAPITNTRAGVQVRISLAQ